MIRILLYPNIPYPSKSIKLFDDSYIHFLSLFIKFMQKKRYDIFWYIIAPISKGPKKDQIKKIKTKLNFPNTKIIDFDIPKSPFNRIHFNIHDLRRELKQSTQTVTEK